MSPSTDVATPCPSTPLVPVFCCNNTDYNQNLPNYTETYARLGLLTSISYHHYAIGGCGGKTATIDELMSNDPFVLAAAYLQVRGMTCAQA